MTESLVEQVVNDWDDWPMDVVDRLKEWNTQYLLSFRQGPNFLCGGGCHRMIETCHRGNPVVRATKKAHGTVVCEDCLIAFARKFERPPYFGVQAAYQQLKRKFAKQEQILQGTLARSKRLKRQVEIGEIYINRLEEVLDPIVVAHIKNELRDTLRK